MPFGGKKEAIVFSREKTRIIFNLGIFSEYERTKVWSFVFLQARGIAFNHFLLFSKKTRVWLMVNTGVVRDESRGGSNFWKNEKMGIFNKRKIKVCSSCSLRRPGTSVPRAAHLTVSIFPCSSGDNARGMVEQGS